MTVILGDGVGCLAFQILQSLFDTRLLGQDLYKSK
jgi:hypothetical protein